MYRYGERRRKFHTVLVVLVVLLLLATGGGYLWLRSLKPNTYISPAPAPKVTMVQAATTPMITISEPLFTLQLPSGWKAATDDYIHPTYLWSGSGKVDSARALALYVDTIPTQLAVNRVLPVRSVGDGLLPLGDVSDNCSTFTRPPQTDSYNGTATGKWQGMTFLCDLANYERDVVGISSTDGVNTVTLTGKTTGAHKIFMTYTDNTGAPDYTIFTTALNSFHLK